MTPGQWVWCGIIIVACALCYPLGVLLTVGTLLYCMRKDGDL
jgi:hypothetical protein